MTQDVKKTLDRQSPEARAPEHKRVRLSPPMLPKAAALPPLWNARATAPEAPVDNAQKLAELRRKYLEAISMVVQELKAVLTYGPGSASPDAPVPPSVVLKLVRTVQTLEKLQTLLLMNPTRLRRVSLAQLEVVEQQIKTNLLPLATLFRSFDGEKGDNLQTASALRDKIEQKSPRSPSGVPVTPLPQHDWRFLSMALSLQL